MYLEELLPEFRKGAKIRRKEWDNDTYVRLAKDGIIVNNDEKLQVLYTDEILADSWEIYQEPIDWQYIIDNKCLCWFWDIVEEAKIVGILCKINYDSEHKFVRNFDGSKIAYINCSPVHRDEVTFYEDKKDD